MLLSLGANNLFIEIRSLAYGRSRSMCCLMKLIDDHNVATNYRFFLISTKNYLGAIPIKRITMHNFVNGYQRVLVVESGNHLSSSLAHAMVLAIVAGNTVIDARSIYFCDRLIDIR